ncbi:hypothetical protein DXG01_002895, partial [Tephrocybe rancida]
MLHNDFEVIHAREAVVVQVGNSSWVTEAPRSPQHGRTAWVQGSQWAPEDNAEIALDSTREWYDKEVEAPVMAEHPSHQVLPRKPRTRIVKRPNIYWKTHHWQAYLNELLRYEGRGDAHLQVQCIDCIAHKLAEPEDAELLHRGLYPASQLIVKTCATFALLRHLHILGLTTKSSTYDFHRTLQKLTDNMGLDVPKTRYKALQQMCLQWRHLVMLKCGGRGHDPSGANGTVEGDLAVACPTCPHNEKNMAADWKESSKPFLHTPAITMDANFRLKQQLVSSHSQDLGFGTGLSYMVKREPYDSYVLSKASQGDISTCVGFSALAQANTKFLRGLQYTGVVAVCCARGEMLLPCRVANLVKGERYPSMDYVVAQALRFFKLLAILISYDIACQWFKNLFKCEAEWPPLLRLDLGVQVIPTIPKLHEPAHKEIHNELSLNHVVGAGLTDGECIERTWAGHNTLGNSTKTMGPGARHNTLDNHFGFWNWLKYNSMGATLMQRYKGAIQLRNLQVEGHRGFTASMMPGKAVEWEEMCIAWETNPSYPRKVKSPLISDVVSISEAEVHKELAEEKEHLSVGGAALHATSPSGFLVLGLDLKESQRRVAKLAKTGTEPHTSHQGTTLAEQQNALRTKVRSWEQLRAVYMPGLLQFLYDCTQGGGLDADMDKQPESTDLWLPSQLPPEHCRNVCTSGLPKMEAKLTDAQMQDSLEGIRHVLRLKARMIHVKNANVWGQRESTRSRTVIGRVHERARVSAAKYRAARERL